ncbi:MULTISPECIES: O-methyltransferase [Acinetobacter]|mgnify:CR=1 FL=1|uniref:Methyltransferase n=2 Tax=Acinetobacter haemolyticus TaxID=29430 RepID=A0A1L6KNK1_ACIHA|nr:MULTISPECIES: class I SAM-dependent methyltransferase [Acinetobacter]APR70609.1 methyltransferase [Acinetobacter haemolyticus]ATZ67052.1 methyltransferase [Acinetobacter haemolyticus]AZN69391.1 methyltransferase [Acinetobacter haemolyticus]EEH68890.1 O-methyltransferase [Acinetobacter sp. ATCC 27244]EFF82862.1 O-methyltransferase [Acinetobacter haemolyticus ATCC 19194]
MTSTVFLQRIADLYDEFKQHDARQSDRLKRYRNIEAESAKLLAMLVRSQQSKRILEIGTSTGYSTLWLAEAAKAVGAKVQTLEINAFRSAQAKRYAEEFGLEHFIDFWVGDASVYLAEANEPFDFILLDAERGSYVSYWEDLKRLMQSCGSSLIIDNVISHTAEVKPMLELIRQDENFMSTILPVGAGLCLVVAR